MTVRLIRVVRSIALGAALLVSALLCFLWTTQLIFHRHVVRLLSDARSLELHKSTWADAQTVMRRWGRWGYARPGCDAAECEYFISVDDWFSRAVQRIPENRLSQQTYGRMAWLAYSAGLRYGIANLSFVVRDGIVVRKHVGVMVDASGTWDGQPYRYEILARATSVEQVGQWADRHRDLLQFAQHPEYTASRPSGCENCIGEEISYSSYAPSGLVNTISAINDRCFDLFGRCVLEQDLFPVESTTRLFEGQWPNTTSSVPPRVEMNDLPCAIPVWARARDAYQIVAIVDVTNKLLPEDTAASLRYFESGVEIIGTDKGPQTLVPHTPVIVHPVYEDKNEGGAPEPLLPGHKYLLFSYYPIARLPHQEYPFELDRCSVVPDSVENEQAVEAGLKLNDNLGADDFYTFP